MYDQKCGAWKRDYVTKPSKKVKGKTIKPRKSKSKSSKKSKKKDKDDKE